MSDQTIPPSLTERDRKWLQELADGVEPKALTGATPQGVRNRLFRLRHIFGAQSTTNLVAIAMRKGIVQ